MSFIKTTQKEASRPARITVRNILAVLQAFVRKKQRNISGLELPEHIYEQIIWRRVRIMQESPKCWYSGACKVCGCDILGKSMEDRPCSIAEHPDLLEKRKPCYPAMMEKEAWQSYKIIHQIKLFE